MNGRAPRPIAERILASVVTTTSGCWEWQKVRQAGYGRIWVGSRSDGTRRPALAHRAAYEAFVGPIPDGLVLDHLCRNPPCCNPEHLEAVPQRTNVLRGVAPPAVQAKQTHCKRGHAFTPENTYINKGKRYCRICHGSRPTSTARLRPRATPAATGTT
jgi:hypothetical protein